MAEYENIYIERSVRIDGQSFSQDKLLDGFKVTVVLAEPGAGKTKLLDNIARSLGTARMRASMFRHKTEFDSSDILVIDGLDEISKIDQSAIDAILVKASELNPKKIIFASRSAQWEEARTHALKDAFGTEPRIANIYELDDDEQKALFSAYKPGLDFAVFKSGLQSLDLAELLGNPQMLKIFADAYMRSGGKFSTKQQVFKDAVEQLASEKNIRNLQSDRPPTKQIVAQGSELFCKILLSGSAGLSATETVADREFPYATDLTNDPNHRIAAIETGLFKPSEKPDQHEPVHRIVAEYSAARYLVGRLQDAKDGLSLKRVLSVIAPNKTPRDELRGLLAWMATEGNENTEKAVIKIDPYAIISNGDPSQLSDTSKSYLLTKLAELAQLNPYFRGGDIWRDFRAKGFFTPAVVNDVKQIFNDKATDNSLSGLLLDLLQSTSAAANLADELMFLLLSSDNDENIRIKSLMVILELESVDFVSMFDTLLKENSAMSLQLAARLVEGKGVLLFGVDRVLTLLKSIDRVYFPLEKNINKSRKRSYGERHFISTLVRSFKTSDLVWLLDELSRNLTCPCELRKHYECVCRHGRSYLIGKLLDQLFELAKMTPTVDQTWEWTKGLRFEHQRSTTESTSVAALQKNCKLRQSVQLRAFENLTEKTKIHETQVGFNLDSGHSGLFFRQHDYQAITDYAFKTNNTLLWSCFIARHRIYENENFKNPHRAHMRRQAFDKPEFGKAWALQDRAWRKRLKDDSWRFPRRTYRQRKQEKREQAIQSKNQQHFDDNLEQIQSGRHWGWLEIFANGYLHNNKDEFPEMEDDKLPVRALYNSFEFLLEHIPTITDIGKNGGNFSVLFVTHAACLAHYRTFGNLSAINPKILRAMKTRANVHYSSDQHDDYTAFKNEINRLIFVSSGDIEKFIRELIEPALALSNQELTEVNILHDDQVTPIAAGLAIEWMERFPEMNIRPMNTLFDIAASSNEWPKLKQIIQAQIQSIGPPPTDQEKLKSYSNIRDFWFIRRFFFFEDIHQASIDWLDEKKERLFAIQNIYGRGYQGGNESWKELSAQKLHLILGIFIDKWPKAYLPNSWGSGDPPEQTAYRFLSDIIWRISNDGPAEAIPVLDNLLADPRFIEFGSSLKAQKAASIKKLALRDFSPPPPETIVQMLDSQKIATVEDMRALLMELLEEIQEWISGGDTNSIIYFYDNVKGSELEHVDENTATKVIVDRLQLRCDALGLMTTVEHHLHDDKRSDFTLRVNLNGNPSLLVTEVKGQWNRELYTAAADQLDARYAIHPDAENQGVYLVLWFGENHKVAGVKNTEIKNGEQLRLRIIENMPEELAHRIDVFVLDLSN